MRARQTCFCGLFGSGTTVSRRCSSPEVSVNETPGRILQTPVIDKSEEHNNGYICNDQYTSNPGDLGSLLVVDTHTKHKNPKVRA